MTLERAFPALSFFAPVGIFAPPDGTDRLFVIEQTGRIRVFENRDDVSSAGIFLDIRGLVRYGGERGLLGLAFDPDYAQNRRFYLNYTAASGCDDSAAPDCTKIVRYEASAVDPNVADPASAYELLDFTQPWVNHNGGALAFGPDGMLYVANGDGGNAGDPLGHGQNIASRLGAVLRLDVREGASSLVPDDNPFVGDPQADPLVYHYGLRNPWRISFDRLTGDLLIADVGQHEREEVNRVAAGTPGGLNFGWNVCEATLDYGAPCGAIASTPPVIEYEHDTADGGDTLIGGFVYRGEALPELYGAYVYSDATTLNIWAWDGVESPDPWNPGNPGVLIGNPGIDLVSWGEDAAGELHAVSISTGHVYRLVRSGAGGGAFPTLLSDTGFFSDVASLTAAEGMIEYTVASDLWSDGATKRRWIALPGESRITFHADESWQFPIRTAFVKHFSLPMPAGGERPVETRVFFRQIDRWLGVTYRWDSAGLDATLLTDSLEEIIDLGGGATQSWRYPSSNECMTCHTAAAGRVLGARSRQLGGVFDYPPVPGFAGGERVQLEAWNCADLFDIDIRDPARFPRAHGLDDVSATRSDRVRSYVATNCAMCHQPSGPAPGQLDFRFTRAIGEWNAVDSPVELGEHGFPGAELITTGDKGNSMVWLRQTSGDMATRMAQGTTTAHGLAVSLIGDWIDFDTGYIDSDLDGVEDSADLCPNTADPGQLDRDADGVGDACDPDDLPDLTTDAMTLAPGSGLVPGDAVDLSASVSNLGLTQAGDFPVSFYLSLDQDFDPGDDVSIDHCWIESLAAGGSTSCQTTNARLPLEIPTPGPGPGPFALYSLACANYAGISPDANSANDCVVSASPILVPEPARALLQWIGAAALFALGSTRGRGRPPRGRDD